MKTRYWILKLLKGMIALAVGWLIFYLAISLFQLSFTHAFRVVIRCIRAATHFATAANIGFLILYLLCSADSPIWRRPCNVISPAIAALILAVGIVTYWSEPLLSSLGVALFILIPGLFTFLTASFFNRKPEKKGA
ncbi:hypothetical protein [Geminisphaera colitermitum]|uniref:hypothetical protein n=1 Tax=Geminisphaera colitermitum TaxID=1148786 RepID=UPI0012FF2EDD|nr:hypothetical protein [Geminisphaera colitermitum]